MRAEEGGFTFFDGSAFENVGGALETAGFGGILPREVRGDWVAKAIIELGALSTGSLEKSPHCSNEKIRNVGSSAFKYRQRFTSKSKKSTFFRTSEFGVPLLQADTH